jgi:hypothetical protein
VRADEKLRAFLELERLANESFRPCSVGQRGAFASSACLRSFDDLLMLAFF